MWACVPNGNEVETTPDQHKPELNLSTHQSHSDPRAPIQPLQPDVELFSFSAMVSISYKLLLLLIIVMHVLFCFTLNLYSLKSDLREMYPILCEFIYFWKYHWTNKGCCIEFNMLWSGSFQVTLTNIVFKRSTWIPSALGFDTSNPNL